ncbi:MAG: hypothetical protein ACOC0E_11530 [Spirochaetota bacterium]
MIHTTLSTAAFGQEPSTASTGEPQWRLVRRSSRIDPDDPEVSDLMDGGFLPIGFHETDGGAFSLLLVANSGISASGWHLREYSDWNRLQAQITDAILSGLLPVGISKSPSGLTILWIETDLAVGAWRIHAMSAPTEERAERAVRRFETMGFGLWGLTVSDDLMWLLFLRLEQPLFAHGRILTYPDEADAVENGIERNSREGWVPVGLASEDGRCYVAYRR